MTDQLQGMIQYNPFHYHPTQINKLLSNQLNQQQLYYWRMKIFGAARRLTNLSSMFMFSADKTYKYKFVYGSHMIPHPEKAYKGGQDAMFTSDNFLVVADGVGGWADQGVDPGLYSKKLCEIIGKKVKSSFATYVDDPQKLLVQAVKQNKQVGSTTVCILSLHPTTGKLLVYYLGDSVYGFFRNDLVEMAEDQQKSFNYPFQIGSVGDDPLHGVLHEHAPESVLQKTIVVATDGLWDNYDVQKIQKDIQDNKGDFNKLATKIAEGSFKHSLMENYASPFYKKALQHRLRTYKSGKPDDITVVVAKVSKQQIV